MYGRELTSSLRSVVARRSGLSFFDYEGSSTQTSLVTIFKFLFKVDKSK